MVLRRQPGGPLLPFVKELWYADDSARPRVERERVLPTGSMHLVLRLGDQPLRIYRSSEAPEGHAVGLAVVGGAREAHYVRDVSLPSCSVGAVLHPGASLSLLGVPAEALAGRHTALEELWGREAGLARDRLLSLRTPHDRLAAFETILTSRLGRAERLHPAIAWALTRMDGDAPMGAIVEGTGYSHRRILTLFREAVGLTPNVYRRVLRFQRVLGALAGPAARPLSDLALACGYSDQAHFTREFRAFTGVTPTQFRALAPLQPHHVPVTSSNPCKTHPARGSTLGA